jgi:hypothetical protein
MCVTDGTSTCSENQNSSISLLTPCPTLRISANLTDPTEISVFWNHTNGLGTVSYDWALTEVNATTPTFTGTVLSSSGQPLSFTVSNLTPGTSYNISLTIVDSSGNVLTVCQGQSYTVPVNQDVCNNQINTDSNQLVSGSPPDNLYSPSGKLSYAAQKSTSTFPYLSSFYYYNIATNENEFYTGGGLFANPSISFNNLTNNVLTLNVNINCYNCGCDLQYGVSTDMVNWSNYPTISITTPQILTISVPNSTSYIRARRVCVNETNWVIVKYDAQTNYLLTISDVFNNSLYQASGTLNRIDGIRVSGGSGSLVGSSFDCEGELNVESGLSANGYWYYSGKLYQNNNYYYIYHYLYTDLSNRKTVACCSCPAHILKHEIPSSQLFIFSGGTTDITIPYYLGNGSAFFTIISPPAHGTLTQQGLSNVFGYEHNPAGPVVLGDSFTIELGPIVPGDCNSAQATIPITIDPAYPRGTVNTGDHIFAFVNTNSFNSTDEPEKITTVINNLKTTFQDTCPNWSGELYIIPTTSDRWLSYPKAVLDKTIDLNEDPAWVNVRRLPTDWEGGAAVDNTRAYVIAFSNNSSISYHGSNLTSGWFGQPTAEYLQDYEEYLDILNGTELSSWAKTKNFNGTPPFADGVQLVYNPITHDTNGVSAAAILQGLGSYAGDMIEPKSYVVETAVDVSGYLMQGLVPSATNPYKDAVTTNGANVEGLFTKNVKMFLNQGTRDLTRAEYLDLLISDDNTSNFKQNMISMFLDENNACSGTALLMFEWKYCGGEWNKELDSLSFPPNASDGDVYKTESGLCISLRSSTGTATGNVDLPPDILTSTLEASCDCCLSENVAYFVYLCDNPSTTSTILDECGALTTGDVISMDDGTGTIRCWTVSEVITDPADAKTFTKYGDCAQCIAAIS